MNEKIVLNSFPSRSGEALAMAYLNSLDLRGKKPEEIAQIYEDALKRIDAERVKLHGKVTVKR